MSGHNIDDGLVQEYLAECREHLATIEADLLAIEQAGAEINEDLVNRVFRAAHSIKGGAGFFGLSTIRELAHKTENVLDMVRSRQIVPSPESISILLLAFDKLRELVDNWQTSNGADISDFLQALTGLATSHLQGSAKASLDRDVELAMPEGRLIKVSEFDLGQARRGGKCIYLLEYDLIHDIQRKDRTPLEVLNSLISCGTILETRFDLASAGTLENDPSNELMLEVLYATALEPDLIGQLVDIAAERIRLIEKNGAIRPITEAAPEPPPPVLSPPPAQVPLTAPEPVHGELRQPDHRPADPGQRVEAANQTAPVSDQTIRINVALLDSLMTLAGELVLSRNQLNESLSRQDERQIRGSAQRINLVTSELQDVVTQTRMQPVGTLFAKFPRLVRDLARTLGKEVELKTSGESVEIDKSILEGLSDPLTHMVRNAVDHGIETPPSRAASGKPRQGRIMLGASHQAGQVVIEISDDGKGLDPAKVAAASIDRGVVTREQVDVMTDREKMGLIFMPGVSTAEKVSDVSGRGVGMDVVKTNLDRLGGKIEIDSHPGLGTSFRIKLPLTLAIIPSLLVSDGEERFAIPQVNVRELIRIRDADRAQRIDRAGDAQVLILRDRLVPLVHLSSVLEGDAPAKPGLALSIVLVDTGAFEYGLIVEALHDTVEIVVKPLGRHLKALREYAGATILGDGRVAVILDVAGIAARAGLTAGAVEKLAGETSETTVTAETQSLLLFQNTPAETCALPIGLVSRVERVTPGQVEVLGGRRTMQYRGASLPLVALCDAARVGELNESQHWVVIVFERAGRQLGLLAAEPLDMVETRAAIDEVTLRQNGIAGSAVMGGKTVLLLDLPELAGDWAPETPPTAQGTKAGGEELPKLVLVAEDSDFFRGQVRRLIEAVGYRVVDAEDGEAAWQALEEHAGEVTVVATDVEMPRLDGLGLTRRIRSDSRFLHLPVIALTSLAGEDEIARGIAAGVNEYQIKLNQDELVTSIRRLVGAP